MQQQALYPYFLKAEIDYRREWATRRGRAARLTRRGRRGRQRDS